ncbi:hypothetical protein NEA10_09935 [Phormidium yuhuli AB48]|uniref:Uncharacterized protein n=1 Tax=Phormidium yuhuli AB48 TaxID=2940671 RepID=A0ABY5AW20_9CYAN|nr:hypothetical protein [Phormidium yuhuli]USR93008.1 hypothetical protein NEA10_09935 [Phormidium yuhuli AB48]
MGLPRFENVRGAILGAELGYLQQPGCPHLWQEIPSDLLHSLIHQRTLAPELPQYAEFPVQLGLGTVLGVFYHQRLEALSSFPPELQPLAMAVGLAVGDRLLSQSEQIINLSPALKQALSTLLAFQGDGFSANCDSDEVRAILGALTGALRTQAGIPPRERLRLSGDRRQALDSLAWEIWQRWLGRLDCDPWPPEPGAIAVTGERLDNQRYRRG